MKVLMISAKVEHPSGGIAVWTDSYLKISKHIEQFFVDLVNVAMIGKRAIRATTKRNIRDEIIRTHNIFKQLNGCLKRENYDVAHLNTSVGAFGIVRDYMIAKKLKEKKIPCVVHFHCDIQNHDGNRIVSYFLDKILKLSSMNLVLCENSQRHLREKYNVDSVKVPNFVDDKLILQSKKIQPDIHHVVFVGRVSREKGAEEVYRAARVFPDIQFSMIGEVSNEAAAWERPDNVVLCGIKEHGQVLEELDTADLFIFPSHTEGFSLALAEAMARGLPVIATDVGANAEMLEGQGGTIVPVGDVEAMVVALERMKDAEARREMSVWNINKVRTRYETRQVIRFLLQEYENVVVGETE